MLLKLVDLAPRCRVVLLQGNEAADVWRRVLKLKPAWSGNGVSSRWSASTQVGKRCGPQTRPSGRHAWTSSRGPTHVSVRSSTAACSAAHEPWFED